MMNRSPRSDYATQVMIGLVIVSFLVMTFDIQTSGGGVPGTLRSGAQRLFSPLQALAAAVSDPVVDFVDGVANIAGLRSENAALRETIADLRDDLARAQVDANELAALQALLGLELPDTTLNTTFARVVAGGDTFDFSFTIDKGLDQGVLAGNPVLDSRGNLVGTVIQSFSASAVIAPVFDPRIAVPVVTTGGMRGVAEGIGDGMRLTIHDADQPVLEDELLLTAGSDRYPPDLPMGTVSDSVPPETGTRVIRVRAEPVADIDRLRFVVVVQWPLAGQPASTTTTTIPAQEDAGATG